VPYDLVPDPRSGSDPDLDPAVGDDGAGPDRDVADPDAALAAWGLTPATIDRLRALDLPDGVLGRVLAAPGGRWRVATAAGEVLAEPAGRLRHEAETAAALPAVGDWVAVRLRPGEDRATVVAVLPRSSALVRKAAGRAAESQVIAANLDVVLLASGLDADWNPARLERYVALAWESGARPVVLLTKADLAPDLDARTAEAEAVAVGVPVVAVSARTGVGLDELARHLVARETVALVGSSGVGKSTLVNRLLGVEAQPTKTVRDGDGRGRHTTTVREMFRLPGGALLVDTPGLREVAVWTDADAVETAFDDVARLSGDCRFRDCAHGPEPGCAVREAVAQGALAAERLDDYLRLVREQEFLARKQDPLLARAARQRWKAIGLAGREAMKRKRGERP
jgi:ribosome biogenesis GTPase